MYKGKENIMKTQLFVSIGALLMYCSSLYSQSVEGQNTRKFTATEISSYQIENSKNERKSEPVLPELKQARSYFVSQDYAHALSIYSNLLGDTKLNSTDKIYIAELYLMQQNYTAACDWYRKAAEDNNALAENNLGFFIEKGIGCEGNIEEAKKWYSKAADQNNSLAIENLGILQLHESQTSALDFRIISLYQRLAKNGNQQAQYFLGYIYCEGKGITRNFNEGVKWYREAAKQGNPNAQFQLGELFNQGIGVGKDDKEAVKWYKTAAKNGNKIAIDNLKKLGYNE